MVRNLKTDQFLIFDSLFRLIMPPKRGQRSLGPPANKRRRLVNSTSELTDTQTVTALQPQPSAIDYDKLALAIIKHSTPVNDVENSVQQETSSTGRPLTAVNVQSTTTAATQSSATTVLSSVQQEDQAADASSAGLGALLDKVFTGEPARPIESSNPATIITDGIPLSSSVSVKIKSKVWNNEFIDFRTLLSTREEPLSVSISSGVINLHQGPRFKTPISIAQWTDAFFIFAAVYIEKYPSEAPHLLKYGHMIREIHQLHGDNAFRSYDEQFRKLKESLNVPWQNTIQELRLKAATNTRTFSPKVTQNLGQPFRSRFCFQYNRGERCTRNPCSFRHACMQCRGNHPKSKCSESSKHIIPSTQTKPPNTHQGKKFA